MNYKEYAKLKNISLTNDDPVFAMSNLVTEARLHAGLSQAELAEKIGTKQPSITRAENGLVVPSIEFLEKIAKAIGTYLVPPKFGFMIERENNHFSQVKTSFVNKQWSSSGHTSGLSLNIDYSTTTIVRSVVNKAKEYAY